MGKALTVSVLNVAAVLVAVAIMTLISGCATTASAPAENPRQIWCDHNQPRRPTMSTIAVLSRGEIDELNMHNSKGGAWCGWKAG